MATESATVLRDLTLVELADQIRAKAVSPVEVTVDTLEAIESLNPTLHAFITVCADEALEQAKALEALLMSGVWLGPLHGVPVALKDNIATAGIRTTGGSRIRADWIPEEDATVTTRLKRAGAIVAGKAHTYEFAYAGRHHDYPEARNPWDLTKCAGASSSGSGSAVGGRLAFGALGTDTGGSIRIPGAACGVVSLKPTYGLVSRAGVFPLSYNLDAVGPFGRTAADVAAQLQALAGYDPGDPGSADVRAADYAAELRRDLRGLVIGYPARQQDEVIDPEVRRGYEAAMATLEQNGATLVEVDVPNYLETRAVVWAIMFAEAAEHYRSHRDRYGDFSDDVRRHLLLGEFVRAVDYVHAQRVREKIRRGYEAVMQQVDVLAMPTMPITAWGVDEADPDIDGHQEGETGTSSAVMATLTRYCPAFNLTGQPSVSIPCGFTEGGLPLAFQVAGRRFEDGTVLRVANAYQQVTDWHRRRPPYSVPQAS